MADFKFVSIKDFIPRSFELFKKGNPLNYSGSALIKDLIAGLTVGVVALPLAIAFSIAAGGTPIQGLYTAIIAGFLISLLGGSRYQVGGPTGAFVVIIYGIISRHGMNGLVIATIMAGIILVLLGISGLGRLIKFIPYPVTTGFTTGIGVLIFSQQIKDFFGLQLENSSPEFFEKWAQYFKAFPTLNWFSLIIGVSAIAVIILVRHLAPRLPASVIGIIVVTVLSCLLKLPVETIGSRFGGLPSGFTPPSLPNFNWTLIRDLFPDALTIALLAAIESLLSAVVADGMTGDNHNSNLELVALGIGNIISPLFGGIPATGAIARTATNIKSGAVSPVSGMVHALVLLLFVLFLSPIASIIPLTALTAVLMVVAWDLSDIDRFIRLLRRAPKSDAIVLIVTFILTVIVDLTVAVEVGVILAVFLFVKRMIEVSEVKSSQDLERILFSDQSDKAPTAGLSEDSLGEDSLGEDSLGEDSPREDSNRLSHPKDIEVFEINGPFFFGVADLLQETLISLEKKPRAFILRLRLVPAIDSTGIAALESLAARCRHSRTSLFISEIREQPAKALERAGFLDSIGRERVTATVEEAIELAKAVKG